MKSRSIVYCCQLAISWENKEANFDRVRSLLRREPPLRDSLLVLPEMFATGFSMNVDAIAEGGTGPTTDFLREVARQWKIYVLGGVVRRASHAGAFNEAVCFAPSGESIARYAKLHLFTPGGEAQHYRPGGQLVTFGWRDWQVSPFICYDLRFPEIYRLAAQKGAGMFVVIANWPTVRQSHWSALLQARAIENQAYVVGVNRCGNDPRFEYAGGSVVVSPRGETVVRANSKERILAAELDLAALSKWRRDFPALKDLRTSFVLKKG